MRLEFLIISTRSVVSLSQIFTPSSATSTWMQRLGMRLARSHHVHAMTGKPQGGFALALEEYPPEVWRNFMFNQLEVAKKMGATPNIVPESARSVLFDLVNKTGRQTSVK